MKYMHTNIISKDWKKLADFYIKVFDCKATSSERNLFGEWLEKGTGVKNAKLKGAHLVLPGYEKDEPTLEIFQYDEMEDKLPSVANRIGFGHLAFSVDDVQSTYDKLLENGGQKIGEVVNKDYGSGILIFVYAADPDGNIIEIQNWKPKNQ
jgi:catechol 2,3-dioxygenase-like lactoylglutathione lyase family enzyme